MGVPTIEDPGRSSGGGANGGTGGGQDEAHGLRTEGQHRRRRLQPHEVPGVGPPPDHAPGNAPVTGPEAPTSVTRASSARTDSRRGPDSTTRSACSVRTSARPAEREQGGVRAVHQRSRPMERATPGPASPGRTTDGWPRRPSRRPPWPGRRWSPATQRSSCEAHGSPSRTQWHDSSIRARTASTGERAPPATSRRTAASPSARRAVRADHAKGVARSSGGVAAVAAQRGPDLVAGDANGPAPARGRRGRPTWPSPPRARRPTRTDRRPPPVPRGCRSAGQPRGPGRPVASHAAQVRGDRPEMLLADVLDAVAAGGRLQQGQPERRGAAAQGLEQRQVVQRPALRAHGPLVESPSAHSEAVPRCGRPTSRSKEPVQHRPGRRPAGWPRGRWSAASSPGRTGGPVRSGSAAWDATVSARAARAAPGQRLDVPHQRPRPPTPAARRARRGTGRRSRRSLTSWRNSACTSARGRSSSDSPSSSRHPAGEPSSWRGPRKSGGACSPRVATTS